MLALAATVLPHARANMRCYPRWNAQKTAAEVVWDGAAHALPFGGAFNVEVEIQVPPANASSACTSADCAQRLWCTDSGVVGRYGYG